MRKSTSLSSQNEAPAELRCLSQGSAEESKGATLVEYMLLLALIVVVALVALQELSRVVSLQYSDIGSSLDDAFRRP